MNKIILIALAVFALTGCKIATISDQYGPLVTIENGQFKDMESLEEYSVIYEIPQDVDTPNSPMARLGIPTKSIKQVSVKRNAKSTSQGGTIFSAIGDACVGAAKLAAGVF